MTDPRMPGPGEGDAGGQPATFDGAGDFQPGELIPGTDYVVQKLLGEGGHASAYECENRIGKRVAVKVMHRHLAARADLVERMVVEARRTVQLRHRNIVEVHTAGMTTGDRPRAYIEMELLNGSNGRQLLLLKERLEVPHALDVLVDICHALDTAHRAGIVHQDLKPDNIFIHLDEWSGKAITKLLDFGVARILGQANEGMFEGTIPYAAPEQLRGLEVTSAADLYSLGVIAFELITGRRPFDAAEALDDGERKIEGSSIEAGFFEPTHFTRNLVEAILTQPPPRLCDYVRLPRPLEDLVLQLLAKDPADRPESAKAVANVLQSIRTSPSLPKSVVTTQEILLNAANSKSPLVRGATLRMGVLNVAGGDPAEGSLEAAAAQGGVDAAGLPYAATALQRARTPEPVAQVSPRAMVRTPDPYQPFREDPRARSPVATNLLPSAPGLDANRLASQPGANAQRLSSQPGASRLPSQPGFNGNRLPSQPGVQGNRLPSQPGFDGSRTELLGLAGDVRISSQIDPRRGPASAVVGTFEPVMERRRPDADVDAVEPEAPNPTRKRARQVAAVSVGLLSVLLVTAGVVALRREPSGVGAAGSATSMAVAPPAPTTPPLPATATATAAAASPPAAVVQADPGVVAAVPSVVATDPPPPAHAVVTPAKAHPPAVAAQEAAAGDAFPVKPRKPPAAKPPATKDVAAPAEPKPRPGPGF